MHRVARARWLLTVLLADSVFASTEHAQHEVHQQRPEVVVRCTTGSFIDQFAVINSMLIALRDQQSARVKAELHSVLQLAIKRAALESDCMEPKQIPKDYRVSYNKMMRRALNYLQSQKIAGAAAQQGEVVIRYLAGKGID
jgi:hypothetical protein